VPPAVSAKNHAGGRTQILNEHQIKIIDRQPAESDEDSAPQTISDTRNWPDWNGYLDTANDSKDDWEADAESEIELDSGIDDPETPEQWDVSATLNRPGLSRPTRWSKTKAEKVLMMVNTMATRKNKGNRQK